MTPLDRSVENRKEEMIQTLQRLIRIESVKEKPLPGAPFGTDVAKALDEMLSICRELGFMAVNVNHYMGYAEYGEGNDTIGIMVHLDVVPADGTWDDPPFAGVLKDGKVYGRGSVDDKGPAVYSLYALAALKDAGIMPKKKIRLLFGCDEESGWADVAYYNKKETMPPVGFSPDGAYPVINAEKGLLHLKLERAFHEENQLACKLISLIGGKRPNIVPGTASAIVSFSKEGSDKLEQLKREEGVTFSLLPDENVQIIAQGIPAHGSKPQLGVNAISRLLKALSNLMLAGEKAEFTKAINQVVGLDWDGRGFGLQLCDEISGPLTLNLGMMRIDEKSGGSGSRHPVSYFFFPRENCRCCTKNTCPL